MQLSHLPLSLHLVLVTFKSEFLDSRKVNWMDWNNVKMSFPPWVILQWVFTGKQARYGICIIYWKPSSSINKNFTKLTLQSLQTDLRCSLHQQMGLSDSLILCTWEASFLCKPETLRNRINQSVREYTLLSVCCRWKQNVHVVSRNAVDCISGSEKLIKSPGIYFFSIWFLRFWVYWIYLVHFFLSLNIFVCDFFSLHYKFSIHQQVFRPGKGD